ncbi:MAG: ABC transporter substrate-binding protein [Clostridia bacterium]
MKKICSVILIVAMLFVLASCQMRQNGTGDGEENLQNGTVINLQMRQPDSFDPLLTERKSVRDALLMVYEPLFNITDKFGCEMVLAENYAFNENATILTVRIKEGVFWHDGTPFISDDVVYTVNKIMYNPKSSYYDNLKNLQRVESLSNYEVAFYLNTSDAQFIYTLYFPIVSKNYTDGIINGTGAYMLNEEDGKSLKLVKNPLWHGGEVLTENVNVIYMRTSQMAQEAFSSGKLHALTMDMIDTENFPIKKSNTKHFYTDGIFEFIGFNTKRGIFSDHLLRIAATNAINRGEMEKIFSDGTSAGFPGLTGSDVFSPSYELSAYNLDYAREVIFSAGWTDLDYDLLPEKIFDGEIKNMEFTLLCANSDPLRQEAAYAIKSQLEEALFTVNVEIVDVEEFNTRLSEGDFDAYIGGAYYDKPYDVYEFFATNGKFNYQGYSSNEMDSALKNFSSCINEADAQAAFEVICSVFAAQQPIAGLVLRNAFIVTNKYIEGEINPYPYSPYANVHKWIVK